MSSDHDPRAGTGLPSEEELLREARALLPAVDNEPRPGFAARVAARAAEQRANKAGTRVGWLGWLLPGASLACAAALALLMFSGPRAPKPGALAKDQRVEILEAPKVELAMAERLELYQQLTLIENADALDELDVVAHLHQLRPEAKP